MSDDRAHEPRAPSFLARCVAGAGMGLAAGLLGKDLGLRNVVSFWGSVSPVVPILMLVCMLLWLTRARWVVYVLTFGLCALWLVVGFSPLCMMMAGPLRRADPVRHADAIYVLSSNMQPDDEPTAGSLARATRGLELLGSGLAPKLLISEVPPPSGSYEKYLKASAQKQGVDHASGIEDIGLVTNTHDEAVKVAKLFQGRGWHTLLLVTSPTHSRRAASTFEHAGIPDVISVPAVETQWNVEHLRFSDERIDAFGAIVHEWIGLAVYKVRGWR